MVHLFKQNGQNLALDVNSGALLSLDDLSYDILSVLDGDFSALPDKNRLSGHSEEDMASAFEELKLLKENGTLFAGDEYIDLEKFNLKDAPIKAMCLHIAHDCNLKCEYCFADGGEYHQIREKMPFEVAKKAIDFLISSSKGRKNLEVDFFGGEPLLNFDVVKKTVEYAKTQGENSGKNFRFTITTNGLLLDDEKIEYINENMDNVVISLDGRKEINDRVRKRLDGTGCYERILTAFQKLAESRNQDKYYIRGTFTRYNLDFYKDVLHLADLGFKQISVEPVTAPSDAPYSIRKEDLPEVFRSYDILAKEILSRQGTEKAFNFFHFMIDIDGGPCVIKRLSGCGSGNEYIAITPSGEIYPCHQFVGNREFVMGSLFDSEPAAKADIKACFSCANVYTKEKCRSCFAKFYCSGGCNANNYNACGNILIPDDISCEMQRKRVECALMIKAVS